jgi:hypothetical protein
MRRAVVGIFAALLLAASSISVTMAAGLFLVSPSNAPPGGPPVANAGINLNLGNQGQAFINFMLTSGGFTDGGHGTTFANLDANDYPTGTLPNQANFTVPNIPLTYTDGGTNSGEWVLDWIGEFSAGGTAGFKLVTVQTPTILSSSGTGTVAAVSGVGITVATNGRNTGSVHFKVASIATAGPNWTGQFLTTGTFDFSSGGRIRLYRADQATRLANGEIFNPAYLSAIKAMKPNALRWLDGMGYEINTQLMSKYTQRIPTTAMSYNTSWFPGGSSGSSSVWAGDIASGDGGTTYTASAPGAWGTYAGTVNTNGTTTVTIASGLSAGVPANIYINIAGVAYWVATASSGSTFTTSATVPTATGSQAVLDGATIQGRFTTANANNWITLNVSSSGAFDVINIGPNNLAGSMVPFNVNADSSGNVTVNYGNTTGKSGSGTLTLGTGFPAVGGFVNLNGLKVQIASITDNSHFAVNNSDGSAYSGGAMTGVWLGSWSATVGNVALNSVKSLVFQANTGLWMMFNVLGGFPQMTPLEIQVALANQTQTNLWIQIPHTWDMASVQSAVTYVASNLNNGLKLYVEYGNENWNGSFLFLYYSLIGQSYSGIGAGGIASDVAPDTFIAFRHAQVMRAAATAWSGGSRSSSDLVRIAAWQGAGCCGAFDTNFALGTSITTGNGYPVSYNSSPNRPIDVTDAIATAPYYNGGVMQFASGNWSNVNNANKSWSGTASVTGTTMTVTAVTGNNQLYPGSFYNLNSGGSVGTIQAQLTQSAQWTATGSIATSGGVTTLTVSGVSGTPAVGDIVAGTGITANTFITKVISAGASYQLSTAQTVASESVSGSAPWGIGTYKVVSSGDAASASISGVYNGAGLALMAADRYAAGDTTNALNTVDTDARYGSLNGTNDASTPGPRIKTLAGRAIGDFISWAGEASTYSKQYFQYEGGYQAAAPTNTNLLGGSWSATASISGTTLSIPGAVTGQVYYGAKVTGGTTSAGTYVTGQLTGTPGGTGTYSVNNSQTVASASLSGSNVDSSFQTDGSTFTTGTLQILINAYKNNAMFKQLVLDAWHSFLNQYSSASVPSWYTFEPGANFWQMTPGNIDVTPYFKSDDAAISFGAGG